jgi:hypothetical protein
MAKCECRDKGCGALHAGSDRCGSDAVTTLYRIDQEDRTGAEFCDSCAEDANASGVYTDSKPDEEVSEGDFLEYLSSLFDDQAGSGDIQNYVTFEEVGYLTTDTGLVVTYKGQKFNLTIQEENR